MYKKFRKDEVILYLFNFNNFLINLFLFKNSTVNSFPGNTGSIFLIYISIVKQAA